MDNIYCSLNEIFSPRISGVMGSSMTKKQGKIRFFEDIETDGSTSRPLFYGELDHKTLEYRRIGPHLAATFFFYCNIFDKNFFLVLRLIDSFLEVDGGGSIFRCFTVSYKFSLSFDPNFMEKSWDISTPNYLGRWNIIFLKKYYISSTLTRVTPPFVNRFIVLHIISKKYQ